MPTRIPRYVSNTDKNLKIGVSNYSEDKVSLEVIGLVGIGSTTPTDILDVQGTTKSKGLNVSGVSTFNDDVVFQGAAANQKITFDHSENDLEFSDLARLKFGDNDDLEIWHGTGNNSHIKNSTNDLKIRSDSLILKREDDSEAYLKATVNSDVKIYHNGNEKFATTKEGVIVSGGTTTGTLSVTGVSTFAGAVDLNAGLDIDGQLDVDELVVAGVSTFSNAVDINSTLDVDGDTQLDDLTVAGFATFTNSASFAGNVSIAGTLTYEDVTNIDAVGLITARNGVRITAGGINVTAGISTFGGNIDANGDLDVDGQTDLDVLNVSDTATFSALVDVNNRLDVVGGANIDQLNVTGVSTFAGGIDANGTLDVDGDTQLDDLNVAGVATFSKLIDANNRLDVVGGANVDQLNISGVSTFVGVSTFSDNVFISGELRVGDTTFGTDISTRNLLIAGISTFTGDIIANGNITGDTATNISGINSVTATSFFGDGSGLENTGATLSAASGSQRLVLTSLTSGTMTSAATDADLAFNATSNLLSAGKLNVTGLTTISNLKVDSGIVTAASGIATYNGDLVIGTPSAGFKSGAFSINTTDKTKDSINELNFILGKLVPDPPDTINGASFTLSGLGNGRLCTGFTPVNNTGGSHAVAAGRQYSRNTDSTVTSNTLTDFGPGDSETVTGFVNAVGVGTTTLTVGVNNGTFDKLVISNNEDAANSSRNPGITSQFYEIYDARLLNAASPDGFNKAFISQGISTTTSAFWYEDPSTVSAPVISFSPVTYPASPTLSYSSGIPHYTQASANAFTYALGVENASGDMYTQNTFVSSDGQTSGFQNPGNKSYTNFTGGTNPPARNYGVGAAVTTQISQQPRDLHLTATSNVFTSFDASTPYGSHNNQRVGFTTDVNIMGTTARTNKIDEDNILISSLGTGSGNATRVNAGSTGDNPSPVFTAWGGGSAGSIATYEAAVRGGTLRHDQTDYSDGSYLPVGPDYSGSRSGTQYFQIELIRSNVSEFSISYTGSAAGCFVCMPQNSAWTTSLSGVNGWADMFQAYKGSGIPTSAEPGCSSGGLMDNDGGTFTCVFGTESSSNDTGNRILIRWKLTSGQSITAMSFTST